MNYFNFFFFINLANILFLLTPIFLVTGPLIPEISIIFIFFIVYFSKLINFNDKNIKKFTFFFLIFYIFINISSFFSPNYFISFSSSIPYLRHFFFIIAIYFIIKKNFKILNLLKFFLLVTFFSIFIDASVQLIFEKNIFGFPLLKPNNQIRVSSFFGEELIMGSFIVRFLPILLGLILLSPNNKIKKLFFYSVFLISSYLVVISGERLSFIYLLLLYLIFFVFIKFNIKEKLIFILILLFFFSLLISTHKNIRIIDATIKELKTYHEKDDNSKYYFFKSKVISDHHKAHAITAYNIFLNSPLFGNGVRSFRIMCSYPQFKNDILVTNPSLNNNIVHRSCSTHPHNTYLQLLAETGIVPTLIIFMVFIFSVYKIFKISLSFKKRNYDKEKININNFNIFLLGALIINFLPMLPSGNFFNNWLSIVYSIPIGILLITLNLRKVRQ